MMGSAIIGGFILAMIEGTGILINRYSQMLMPAPDYQGNDISLSYKTHLIFLCVESSPDPNKGKGDLSIPQFFGSSPGSSAPSNFS